MKGPQLNQLELQMAIILNTVSFEMDTYQTPNRVNYVSPTNTFTAKDVLSLARTPAKPGGGTRGVARASVKRTRTVTLDDGTKQDAIVEITCSLPVGMSKTDADALRDDVGDFAISAAGDALFWKHDLTN